LKKNRNAVNRFPIPSNTKEVRSFLGLVRFNEHFIPNMANLAQPLIEVIRGGKSQRFSWGPEQHNAFENLKRCLTSAHVLIHPDYSKPFMLITDASQVGMGAVLCQLREEFLRTIRYISKTFDASQRNYTMTECECLAIIESIKILRPILFGTKFIVVMDHAALKHLREFKDLSSREMRWATYLAPLTFGIKFRPGMDNVSDSLSRIDLKDIDYKSAKNLELQEGLSYLSLAMSHQEATEEKKIDEMEVEETILVDKPPPTQKMLKWL